MHDTFRGNVWQGGEHRTPESINADYEARVASGKGAAEHNSVENTPIRLPDRMWQQKVLLLLPPDPLHHVLIGPPNTLLTSLLKKYPRQIRQFYKSCGLLRRALYGGQCTGEQIKRIWNSDENLQKLLVLPNGQAIVRYLKSLRAVHMVSVSKELCPEAEYTEVFDEFRASLQEMIGLKLATHTPKCHIASGHFEEYFKLTGRTLYYADCSAVEAAHSLLRQSEEAHRTKTIHDHGSDNHLKRFKSSIVIFSSKNFGPDTSDDEDSDIEFHEIAGEDGDRLTGGVEEMDISQFVTAEPEVPSRVKREMARLRTKVECQAEQLREKDETIRALREQLKRYEAAEANNIRDEIFDENDNVI